MKIDNKVKLRKEFQLSYLMIGENFGGQEILQIFVICNNIYKKFKSFQIVILDIESFKDHKKFFIVYIIAEFNSFEYVKMEYN